MRRHVVSPDACSSFKSPVRILVRFFRRSRDQWKQKYMDLKSEIKRYKNQAADARRSRDQWKVKVEALAEKTRRLEWELAQQRVEQDANKNLCLR
jgi:uncharacterized protein YdaU (DUF1376 family)